MAQVVAARLDVILSNHRLLTVKIDGGTFGGGISTSRPAVDCSTRMRRSFVEVSSSRADIASRANAVTIAVNNAAFTRVRIENDTMIGRTHENQEVVHIFLPLLHQPSVPLFCDRHVFVPDGLRLTGDST